MENQRQFSENTVPDTTVPASETMTAEEIQIPRSEASSFGTNAGSSNFPPPPKRQDYTAPPPRADAATSRESPSGHHTGSNIINKVKGVAAQGHGLGENLRGNFNAAVDTAFNDKEGQVKDEAIAGKGEREVINKEFDHSKGTRKLA